MYSSRTSPLSIVFLSLLGLSSVGLGGEPPKTVPVAAEVKTLTAVLQSNATEEQKLRACQRLAVVGTKEAIPALATLLADPRLSHPARIALEQIPDPAAGETLLAAVGRLKGPLLVGVVNSIGVRRDAKAVNLLAPLLADKDPAVAGAAATALGRIGTAEAAQRLSKAMVSTDPAARAAVGDACLRCAEALAAGGNTRAALELFDRLRKADVPNRVQAAAWRGAILGRPASEGILAEALRSPSPVVFAIVLRAARELHDPAATPVLLAALPQLDGERQAALIAVLGDRGDPAVRPAVLQAARNSSPLVRVASVTALGQLGGIEAVGPLLEASISDSPELAAAAREALVALSGSDVDRAIVEMLAKSQDRGRLALVEVVGRRRIAAAIPELTKLADVRDAQLRGAAILALGRTIPLGQLPQLVDRFLTAQDPADIAALKASIQAACTRMADKQVCAEVLIRALGQAGADRKVAIYELLASASSPAALAALAAGALDADEQVQDVATRVLGDWSTPAAADALLEVAKKAPNARFRVRSLRGYLRIVRQMDMADRSRLEMCKRAMDLAQRDEERKLVLEALGRVPLAAALDLVVPHLQTASLKVPASAAAVAIAERLDQSQAARAAAAMRHVLEATQDKNLVRRANEVLQRMKPAGEK